MTSKEEKKSTVATNTKSGYYTEREMKDILKMTKRGSSIILFSRSLARSEIKDVVAYTEKDPKRLQKQGPLDSLFKSCVEEMEVQQQDHQALGGY